MRTKDEILGSARNDISSKDFREDAPLWMEYRKLEVLIDIRDILYNRLSHISRHIESISEKD